MDNCNNYEYADAMEDNLSLVDTAANVVKGIGDIRSNIVENAKRKKAQKISDAGGYLTLSPYQKSLIQIPDYIKNLNVTPDAAQKSEPIPATPAQLTGVLKNYLPFIVGAIVLGLVVYFFVKR